MHWRTRVSGATPQQGLSNSFRASFFLRASKHTAAASGISDSTRHIQALSQCPHPSGPPVPTPLCCLPLHVDHHPHRVEFSNQQRQGSTAVLALAQLTPWSRRPTVLANPLVIPGHHPESFIMVCHEKDERQSSWGGGAGGVGEGGSSFNCCALLPGGREAAFQTAAVFDHFGYIPLP